VAHVLFCAEHPDDIRMWLQLIKAHTTQEKVVFKQFFPDELTKSQIKNSLRSKFEKQNSLTIHVSPKTHQSLSPTKNSFQSFDISQGQTQSQTQGQTQGQQSLPKHDLLSESDELVHNISPIVLPLSNSSNDVEGAHRSDFSNHSFNRRSITRTQSDGSATSN